MHELFENGVLDNVNEMSGYFFKKLNGLRDKYPEKINLVRGMGLLIGVQMKKGLKSPAIEAAQKHGLFLAGAGGQHGPCQAKRHNGESFF